jgi:hypothetical protein
MENRTGDAFRQYRSYCPPGDEPADAGATRQPRANGPERLPFDALEPVPQEASMPMHIQFLEDRS